MSRWPSTKAKQVLAALKRKGWDIKRTSGSHRTLQKEGSVDFVFSFHDREETGPRMLARIAKHTGLNREIYDAQQEKGVKEQFPLILETIVL